MANQPTFQLIEIRFKHPKTGKEFAGVGICKSIFTPEEFEDVFASGGQIGDVLEGLKISAPMGFVDAGGYSEIKELMNSISDTID